MMKNKLLFCVVMLSLLACSTARGGGNTREIDLRPFHDSDRVLRNPHKGWYHHYWDDGLKHYPPRNDSDLWDFPGMDHIYIRLAWFYFEPEEGKYDWSLIDDAVAKWVTAPGQGSSAPWGFGLALRFTTKETNKQLVYATPKWVSQAGAKGQLSKSFGQECWRPDYNNPVFLEKLGTFVHAAGARYDGKPWLRYVDIGIGTWGEGHDLSDGTLIPLDAVIKHIDIYRSAFAKTQLILSDDAYHFHDRPKAERACLKTYCEKQNIGWRDDSILVPWYVHTLKVNVAAPELYTPSFEQRPNVLELDHYPTVKREAWKGKDGAEFGADLVREAVRVMHPSYIGYHGDAVQWLKDNPNLTRELLNRCGYWLFPVSAALPETVQTGQTLPLKLVMENRGVAPPYQPYTLRIKLTGKNGSALLSTQSQCNTWLPGEPVVCNYQFCLPSDISAGEYDFSLGLFDTSTGKNRPVELALRESIRDTQGYYRIATITVAVGKK